MPHSHRQPSLPLAPGNSRPISMALGCGFASNESGSTNTVSGLEPLREDKASGNILTGAEAQAGRGPSGAPAKTAARCWCANTLHVCFKERLNVYACKPLINNKLQVPSRTASLPKWIKSRVRRHHEAVLPQAGHCSFDRALNPDRVNELTSLINWFQQQTLSVYDIKICSLFNTN